MKTVNTKMEDQLKQLGYTDIKVVETAEGTGYVGTKGGGSIIIPPDCENTDGLSMLVCGQDGTGNALYGNKWSGKDTVTGETLSGPQLVTNAKNGEFPSNAVVIAPNDLYYSSTIYGHYSADSNKNTGTNVLNDAYNLLESNGANITNVGVQSFSNGGSGSMLALGSFLELHSDKKINTKVVLCDTYNVEQIVNLYDKKNLNDSDKNKISAMNTLINNGTEIYSLNWTSPKVYNGHAANVESLSKKMSTLGFNYQFTKSTRLTHAAYMSDFFQSGGLEFLSGSGDLDLNGDFYSDFYKYDENGNEVINKNGHSGGYKYSTLTSVIKYNYLTSATPIRLIGNSISSETAYVCNQMNQLRDKIKASNFLSSGKVQVFGSSSGIPGCISKYINAYYNIVGELMSSLMSETEVVTGMACAYDDMEVYLTTEVEAVSEDEPAAIAGSSASAVVTAVVDGITAASSTADHVTNNSTVNSNVISSGTESTSDVDSVINETSVSPRSKIVCNFETRDDGSKLQISSKDEKIVDLRYVYEYANNREANENINQIKEKFKAVDYISDVHVDGNKIEVIFKQDSYANMEYDAVVDRYLDGGK